MMESEVLMMLWAGLVYDHCICQARLKCDWSVSQLLIYCGAQVYIHLGLEKEVMHLLVSS